MGAQKDEVYMWGSFLFPLQLCLKMKMKWDGFCESRVLRINQKLEKWWLLLARLRVTLHSNGILLSIIQFIRRVLNKWFWSCYNWLIVHDCVSVKAFKNWVPKISDTSALRDFSGSTNLMYMLLQHVLTSSLPRSLLPFSLLSAIQFLWCQFWEVGIGSTNNHLTDIFHYSHHLSACYYVDIIWRNSILVTYGS